MSCAPNNRTRRRWLLLAAIFCGTVGIVSGGTDAVVAQSGPTNPTDETINKRPYVLILMDSSASMEWTEAGAGRYPSRVKAYDNFPSESDPYPSQPDNFRPDMSMGISDTGDSDLDASQPSSDPLMFGSCYVWEPPCDQYHRPSWDADNYTWTPAYNASMERRLQDMRETSGGRPVRLMNFSQPRHVTFKEILTGEMVLGTDGSTPPTQLNWQRYGPGCWFVPRQRDAAYVDDPVCCRDEDTITQPDGSTETICSTGYSRYDQFPDHTDPRPHLQEVFDDQIDNGLMDNMQSQVHFAVTSFDSYKFPMDGNRHTTDGTDDEETVDWDPYNLDDPYTSQGAEGPYDLGVYRIVGPHTFPTQESDIESVNGMAQKMLRDSGTLKAGADWGTSFEIGPVGSYADAQLLSRQPVAKNTPLGPAVHDIHDFFLSPDGPLYDDPYNGYGCRRKHAILMTDGLPLPEAPPQDAQCVGIGQEGLSEAFNINPSAYNYSCTERAISEFVNDTSIHLQNGGNSDGLRPRTHVVGIAQTDWSSQFASFQGNDEKPDRVRKLSSMAVAGRTCAGWYLGNRTQTEEEICGSVGTSENMGPWMPIPKQLEEGYNPDWSRNPADTGYCPESDHPCLVQQYPNNSAYDDKRPSSDAEFQSFGAPDKCPPESWDGCEFPAIILTCNTVEQNKARGLSEEDAREDFRECRSGKWSSKALQQIFNSIVGASGLASRTKAAVTNEIDDNDTSGGQYRLYSGVRVEAGHPMWRGVLFREARKCDDKRTLGKIDETDKQTPCSSSNDIYQCFHKDVGNLIGRGADAIGAAEVDNRRIFTSVPSTRVYDYENGIADESDSKSIDSSCGLFFSNFHLQEENEGRGEFQASHLDADGNGELLLNRRIPLTWKTLKGALVGGDDDSWPLGDDTAGDGDNSSNETLYSYLNTASVGAAKQLLESVRGQTVARERRELAAILNSNPATVEPPKQDVPIESYREFKERFQGRPTMLYFATMDGMLHALHTGVMDNGNGIGVMKRQEMKTIEGEVFKEDPYSNLSGGSGSSSKETVGSAAEQREAWAYLPHMLHDDLAGNFAGKNPNLMDGSPTVKNVRLCHAKQHNNQNMQACNVATTTTENLGGTCTASGSSGSSSSVPASEQWRTVLVQGLGQAGSGYFALDVTRPGGSTREKGDLYRPDPVPLWEFDPYWEMGQLEQLFDGGSAFPSSGQSLMCPPAGCSTAPDDPLNSCADNEEFWQQPFMGQSVSKAAIGTVVLPSLGGSSKPMRRPVAIFGAGGSSAGEPGCSGGEQLGEAVYVVDLQTGSILRRFVGYVDKDGNWQPFDAEMVGAPGVYSGQPGRLASRAFIGDSKGRMFRIDFSSSGGQNSVKWDPAEWQLQLFKDPNQEFDVTNFGSSTAQFGAAQLQPAIARDSNDNIVVVYGLGAPNDTASEDLAHLVMAVRERPGTQSGTEPGKVIWHVGSDQAGGFKTSEKVTGAPVIFNDAAYFTSYAINDSNVCQRGTSHVWGVDFDFDSAGSNETLPTGVFNCGQNVALAPEDCGPADSNGFSRYFTPAENAIVQGLTITLGPPCSAEVNTPSSYATMQGQENQNPQLIVQTGGSDPGGSSSGSGGGGGGGGSGSGTQTGGESDFVHRKSVGLQQNYDRTVPMSWSVVN